MECMKRAFAYANDRVLLGDEEIPFFSVEKPHEFQTGQFIECIISTGDTGGRDMNLRFKGRVFQGRVIKVEHWDQLERYTLKNMAECLTSPSTEQREFATYMFDRQKDNSEDLNVR